MYTFLRWIAEWKSRRRAVQVIVFDGGAEVDRSRAFFRGVLVGGAGVLAAVLLTAPVDPDRAVMREAARREVLLRETEGRLAQALQVADACLGTAQTMERTLARYREMVEAYPGVLGRR